MSKGELPVRNVLGGPLAPCCLSPMTGFYRTGSCETGPQDLGSHVVCAQVTKEFLEFARDQRLELKVIDLRNFLADVVDVWQPVTAERDIILTLERADDLPVIHADEDKLRRVFENLVKNAAEAIIQGPGRISIRLETCLPVGVRVLVENLFLDKVDERPGRLLAAGEPPETFTYLNLNFAVWTVPSLNVSVS